MRNPGGFRIVTEPGKAAVENDTFTCAHGNEIVIVPPGIAKQTVGAYCRACGKHICEKCAREMDRTLKCVPFERRLEQMEDRRRFRRNLGV